jgi:hypothetical protein
MGYLKVRAYLLIGFLSLLFLSSLTLSSRATISNSAGSTCISEQNPSSSYNNQSALAYGNISENLWNLQSSSGSMQQCIDSSGFSTSISLNPINYINVGPAGYPEYGYGHNMFNSSFGQQSPILTFPQRMSVFDSLNYSASVTYNLGSSSGRTIISTLPNSYLPTDFAYDLWIEKNPTQGVQNSDVEVMIDPYNNGLVLSYGAPPLPPQPPCITLPPIGAICPPSLWSNAGTFTTTIEVNGKNQSATWEMYTWNAASTSLPHQLIVFVLDQQVSNGTLSLKIQDFLNKAEKQVLSAFSEDISSYYLMGIEIGAEFGFCSGVSSYGLPFYPFNPCNTSITAQPYCFFICPPPITLPNPFPSYAYWNWNISNFELQNSCNTIQFIPYGSTTNSCPSTSTTTSSTTSVSVSSSSVTTSSTSSTTLSSTSSITSSSTASSTSSVATFTASSSSSTSTTPQLPAPSITSESTSEVHLSGPPPTISPTLILGITVAIVAIGAIVASLFVRRRP